MVNKNGEINFKLIIAVVFGIALLIIAVVIGFLLVQNVSSIHEGVETSDTLSETFAPVTSLTNSLTPIGEGITSSSVKTYNDSWMEFDGVNDKIEIDYSSSLNLSNNFTISTWSYVNYNSTVDEDISGIIHSPNNSIQRYSTQGNIYGYVYNNTNDAISVAWDTDYELFKWYNIVLRFENSNLSLWVDGSLKDYTEGITNHTNRQTNLNIGAHTARYMKGAIDEVRIYNNSLTDTQITEIYNSGRQANSSLPSDGLVLWYSFDEQTGTTVYDKSGNGNNAI